MNLGTCSGGAVAGRWPSPVRPFMPRTRPIGSKSRARSRSGSRHIGKRRARPLHRSFLPNDLRLEHVHESKHALVCRMCARDLAFALQESDVGRLWPCGCLFCWHGDEANGSCEGLYNVCVANAVEDTPQDCPNCRTTCELVECIGTGGRVESECLPLTLSDAEKKSLRREPRAWWGIDREHPAAEPDEDKIKRRKCAARREARMVAEEEYNWRYGVVKLLKEEGLVEALSANSAACELHAILRAAANASTKSCPSQWFTDKYLIDTTEGGFTPGLARGAFSAVAKCCGPYWETFLRKEAISFVRCRMVDAGVWPSKMRGKLLQTDAYVLSDEDADQPELIQDADQPELIQDADQPELIQAM